jgi:AraC-like DNA-binding protein
MRNKNVSLDLIWVRWSNFARSVAQRQRPGQEISNSLEVALLNRINERVQLNTAVRYALLEFARCPQMPMVGEVAHEAGLSRRRFAQLFREQIGLTSKVYFADYSAFKTR